MHRLEATFKRMLIGVCALGSLSAPGANAQGISDESVEIAFQTISKRIDCETRQPTNSETDSFWCHTRDINDPGSYSRLYYGRTTNDLLYRVSVGSCFVDQNRPRDVNLPAIDCSRIAFYVGFLKESKYTAACYLKVVNSWNQQSYGQAYIDRDGDPVLQHFIFAPEKLNPSDLDENFRLWGSMTVAFNNHVIEEIEERSQTSDCIDASDHATSGSGEISASALNAAQFRRHETLLGAQPSPNAEIDRGAFVGRNQSAANDFVKASMAYERADEHKNSIPKNEELKIENVSGGAK